MLDRVQTSIVEWGRIQQEREMAGLQPDLSYANLDFLLKANLIYFSVTFILYQVMKRRETGFRLTGIIAAYNVACVFLAGYVVVGMTYQWTVYGLPKFVCNTEDTNERGFKMAHLFYVFYLQKFFEFCDTWFFILRRSFRQVTFLHVFHHSSITLAVGSILPVAFSGDMFLPIFLNSSVHVLMYGHYLVTSLGLKSWWRPYLTALQLTQFVLISAQNVIAWVKGPSCGGPDFGKALLIAYMASMLYLFGNFFVNRYIKTEQKIKSN